GVAGDRLAAVSLAANEPIAPNDTADNRAMNRRIEIRLLPKEGSIRGETQAGGAPAAPAQSGREADLQSATEVPEAPPARVVEEPTAPLESPRPG
ncbi:MAG: hypothetical protein CL931_12785, partial [Deltaproteobacteria bacterium]|nr:hypothetical protein [Deltaproteobacteria bacterium]